ncbi:TPM domain-containing protein [Heyndrickxia acidiproducens]|uniref:TPM domain-containing protein n=1 Tax=Heyndrickxia acidiproducens TaxID=1121084 RepID=UPI00047799D5
MKKVAFVAAIALSLLFAVLGGGVAASADADIPSPSGDIYVQDFAGVLTDGQKQEMISLGKQLHAETKAQVAVLTVDTIGKNTTLEEFSNQAFRKYGLGDEKLNNGVLIVLAMKDEKIRIEVGYGLEGALPDGKIGRILDQYALPYLKENKPDQAIANTYKKVVNETAKEYNVDIKSDPKAYEEPSNGSTATPLSFWKQILIGIGLLFLIFIDFKFFGGTMTYFLINLLSMFFRGGGGGGSGGSSKGGGGSSGGGGASRGW